MRVRVTVPAARPTSGRGSRAGRGARPHNVVGSGPTRPRSRSKAKARDSAARRTQRRGPGPASSTRPQAGSSQDSPPPAEPHPARPRARLERQRLARGILGAKPSTCRSGRTRDGPGRQPEGHLGASLHGGLTATCWDDETRSVVVAGARGVEFAVLVPDFRSLHGGGRAAAGELPEGGRGLQRHPRGARWRRGPRRGGMVGRAMNDRLHQPYRSQAMFPWLDGVLAPRRPGAMGAGLSGAGPSFSVSRLRGPAPPSANHDRALGGRPLGSAHVLAADMRERRSATPDPLSGSPRPELTERPLCWSPNPATSLQACLCARPGSSRR